MLVAHHLGGAVEGEDAYGSGRRPLLGKPQIAMQLIIVLLAKLLLGVEVLSPACYATRSIRGACAVPYVPYVIRRMRAWKLGRPTSLTT